MHLQFARSRSAVFHLRRICSRVLEAKWRIALAGILLVFAFGNMASVAWHWGLPFLMHDPMAGFPRIFLWAWERPENLEFLRPHEAGVALLAKTLVLNGNDIVVHPRLQPIELPQGITTIAVVRIESNGPTPGQRVQLEAVRQILGLASRPAAGIQIDFDARASERSFYQTLLTETRRQLPQGTILSITALASWCIYDAWISGLPIDEAVPMVFRLGRGEMQVKQYLAAGGDFRAARTRFSVGISLDELPVCAPGDRRVYVFNPRPWTRASVNEALRYVREWR